MGSGFAAVRKVSPPTVRVVQEHLVGTVPMSGMLSGENTTSGQIDKLTTANLSSTTSPAAAQSIPIQPTGSSANTAKEATQGATRGLPSKGTGTRATVAVTNPHQYHHHHQQQLGNGSGVSFGGDCSGGRTSGGLTMPFQLQKLAIPPASIQHSLPLNANGTSKGKAKTPTFLRKDSLGSPMHTIAFGKELPDPVVNVPSSWHSLGQVWLSKDPAWSPWEKKLVLLLDNYLLECMADCSSIIGFAQLTDASVEKLPYRQHRFAGGVANAVAGVGVGAGTATDRKEGGVVTTPTEGMGVGEVATPVGGGIPRGRSRSGSGGSGGGPGGGGGLPRLGAPDLMGIGAGAVSLGCLSAALADSAINLRGGLHGVSSEEHFSATIAEDNEYNAAEDYLSVDITDAADNSSQCDSGAGGVGSGAEGSENDFIMGGSRACSLSPTNASISVLTSTAAANAGSSESVSSLPLPGSSPLSSQHPLKQQYSQQIPQVQVQTQMQVQAQPLCRYGLHITCFSNSAHRMSATHCFWLSTESEDALHALQSALIKASRLNVEDVFRIPHGHGEDVEDGHDEGLLGRGIIGRVLF